jgi:hypothetical protein
MGRRRQRVPPPFSVNADSKELSILCFVTLLQVLIPGYLVAARLGANACDFDCRLAPGGRSFGLCIPNPRYTEKCEVNHRGDWGCAILCVGQMTLRLDRRPQSKNADGMSARRNKSWYYLPAIVPEIKNLSRGIGRCVKPLLKCPLVASIKMSPRLVCHEIKAGPGVRIRSSKNRTERRPNCFYSARLQSTKRREISLCADRPFHRK